jgi:hypothetical protein
MKTLNVALLNLVAAASVLAQGSIVFNNRTADVRAPIYGPLGPGDTVSIVGNTATGVPAGTADYGGRPLLSGSGYTAALFAGPQGTPEASLQPVAMTTFRTGTLAGYIAPPLDAVTIPGVPGGQIATLQLRVWDNRGGTLTTWAAAEAAWLSGQIAAGKSPVFNSLPLGGAGEPPSLPPNLVGLVSFNIYYVPEPGTLALLGLGALGLMVFRRK